MECNNTVRIAVNPLHLSREGNWDPLEVLSALPQSPRPLVKLRMIRTTHKE